MRRSMAAMWMAILAIASVVVTVAAPNVSVAAAASVTGRVTQSGSLPVVAATVEVLNTGGATVVASTQTDDQGRYALVVEEGTFDLRFTGPAGSALGQSRVNGQVVPATGVVVDVVMAATLTTVSGRVVDGNGNGIAGANVTFSNMNTMAYYSGSTDPTGHYNVAVLAGTYQHTINTTITPIGPNNDPMNIQPPAYVSYQTGDITFTSDTTLPDTTFTTGTHTITVLDATGTPTTTNTANLSAPLNYSPLLPGDTRYTYTWSGRINGPTTIATLQQITTEQHRLDIRPANGGTNLLTTTITPTNGGRTTILLTGSGGVTGGVDNDGDNVDDVIEAQAPDNDMNGDGTPDYQQSNVTALPILGGDTGEYVAVAVANDLTVTNVSTLPLSEIPVAPPEGTEFPVGLVSFVVPDVEPASDVEITMYVGDITDLTGYVKWNPNANEWIELPSERVHFDAATNSVTIRITDNGIGDDDPTLGRISDPGAPVIGSFDADGPVVTCPATPRFLLRQPNAKLTVPVSDTGSGVASPSITVNVPTTTGGTVQVSVSATDLAGNTTSTSCPVLVGYKFEGFRDPIDDDEIESFRAGRTVPIKWKITDYYGTGVSERSSFVALTATLLPRCSRSVTPTGTPITVTGRPAYLGSGVWQLDWATPSRPTGCYRLSLTLAGDRSPRTATVQLR